MRYVFAVLAMALFSIPTLARPVTIEKAKKFLIKDGRCDFAAVLAFKPGIKQSGTMEMCGAKGGDVFSCGGTPKALCAWDAKVDIGTINERKGCIVGYYDLANDFFTPFYDNDAYRGNFGEDAVTDASMLLGKPCNKETLTQLLNKPSEPRVKFVGDKPKVTQGGSGVWALYHQSLTNPSELVIKVIIDKFRVEQSLSTKINAERRLGRKK